MSILYLPPTYPRCVVALAARTSLKTKIIASRRERHDATIKFLICEPKAKIKIMKILLTGCAGFVGWKTAEFLRKDELLLHDAKALSGQVVG